MATAVYQYPVKLGRFATNNCVDLLYSKPIGNGVFNSIALSTAQPTDLDYIHLDLGLYESDGWYQAGGFLSSGILVGRIESNTATAVTIEISKDSFTTLDDRTAWLTKHSGIHYNFELLRSYNDDGGDIKNALKQDLKVHRLKRINKYSRYSPFGFDYNKDYEYEITLKNITIKDEIELDSIIQASSFVILAQDESVVYPSNYLTNNPQVIKKTSLQPYYGGLQDNIAYRALLKNEEFEWTGNRYKGNMTFIIKG